jgi:hypothetical protein
MSFTTCPYTSRTTDLVLQSKFDARKLREPLFEKGLNAFLENRPIRCETHVSIERSGEAQSSRRAIDRRDERLG